MGNDKYEFTKVHIKDVITSINIDVLFLVYIYIFCHSLNKYRSFNGSFVLILQSNFTLKKHDILSFCWIL